MDTTIAHAAPITANAREQKSSGNLFGNLYDLPLILTKQELAQVLRCSSKHIDHLMGRGVLHPVRLGRCVRFHRANIIRDLEKLGGQSS